MKTIVLDRGAVEAALCASSKERTRYAFDHLRVVNGGTNELSATDGMCLIRVMLPALDPEEARASIAVGIEGDDSGETMVPATMLMNAVSSSQKRKNGWQDGKFLLDSAETETGGANVTEIRYIPKLGDHVAKLSATVSNDQPFPEAERLFNKRYETGKKFVFKTDNLEKALKAAKALKADNLEFSLAENDECWDADGRTYVGAVKLRFSGGGHDEKDVGVVEMLAMPANP